MGVQVHHIDPINKGEIVWYLEPQDIIAIARLFSEGKYDLSRIVSVAGSQLVKPRYYRTIIGSSVGDFLVSNLKEGENRIISGDILTGKTIDIDGALGFYDKNITVIEEGKEQEFLGWILPGIDKFSVSGTFLSWLMPSKKYNLSANMHGEERAML